MRDPGGGITAEAVAANRLKFERLLFPQKHLPPKSEPENPPLGTHSFRQRVLHLQTSSKRSKNKQLAVIRY